LTKEVNATVIQFALGSRKAIAEASTAVVETTS